MSLPLLALLLLSPLTRAQDEETAKALQAHLIADPAARGSLADRIARSKLADRITAKTDALGRVADIQTWIRAHPGPATQIALGLAHDDASGEKRFEDVAARDPFIDNPGAQGNLFYRLKKAAMDSKLLKQAANDDLADEEKNELIKSLFDGKSGASSKVLSPEPGRQGRPPAMGFGYYDRLSGGNLRGYSPQLLALQNALNARRAPGAPKLAETGKLDYETLAYPAYGMRYDVGNLRRRLDYDRAWALAKLLGRDRELSPEQLARPETLAMLESQAGAKAASLSARLAARRAALDEAAAALADFEAAALPTKDQGRITRALLSSLGGKQREAARWITVANLEEELQRLDAEDGFLSPELDAQIERCPVAADVKAAYRRRGQEYQRNLAELKSGDEDAAAGLQSEGWLAALPEVESTLARCEALRKDLRERVTDYVATPYRLASLVSSKPRWREILDEWALWLFPHSAYSRHLAAIASERERLKDAFGKIASGDLAAAHEILAAFGA